MLRESYFPHNMVVFSVYCNHQLARLLNIRSETLTNLGPYVKPKGRRAAHLGILGFREAPVCGTGWATSQSQHLNLNISISASQHRCLLSLLWYSCLLFTQPVSSLILITSKITTELDRVRGVPHAGRPVPISDHLPISGHLPL